MAANNAAAPPLIDGPSARIRTYRGNMGSRHAYSLWLMLQCSIAELNVFRNHAAAFQVAWPSFSKPGGLHVRPILLWLVGIPIPVIILLYLFHVL